MFIVNTRVLPIFFCWSTIIRIARWQYCKVIFLGNGLNLWSEHSSHKIHTTKAINPCFAEEMNLWFSFHIDAIAEIFLKINKEYLLIAKIFRLRLQNHIFGEFYSCFRKFSWINYDLKLKIECFLCIKTLVLDGSHGHVVQPKPITVTSIFGTKQQASHSYFEIKILVKDHKNWIDTTFWLPRLTQSTGTSYLEG